MLVREAKLNHGTAEQYGAIDEAIRTAQFIRNKAVRFWMDNRGASKAVLYSLCKDLAIEFPFAKKLNSAARQASAERAWAAISSFYARCKKGEKKKGFPTFKKHCRSVEYKVSGWKLSEDCMSITFTDGFEIGTLALFCNHETREDLHALKINRVRVVRRADGYYAQFCFDATRKEEGEYTGEVVGLDLGLKYFTKDQNDNAVVYPQFLRKSERRLKKAQRRLSKKFVKGAKPQSKNYHKQRKRLGKVHLKVQRQRKDWAIKQARCVVHSNDVVVYEDLKIANMVKNHHLAKSISDASWYQFTQWLDYYGKIWDKAVVAVSPSYTSQDCSNCGYRVKKSLSTRTHSCPKCGIEICRDTNAAINILKKGMKMLGVEWQQNGTSGQEESAS
ncbi:transposase [Tumidithrix elongata RA019]|uniref:Transposase n=1 Tax=Tumidithrix elongata BACA0141 TaxID=2716417 RepID=A0AAW9PZY2_9CYAN|nr:transposase [Tumidithrix elongata RA019]